MHTKVQNFIVGFWKQICFRFSHSEKFTQYKQLENNMNADNHIVTVPQKHQKHNTFTNNTKQPTNYQPTHNNPTTQPQHTTPQHQVILLLLFSNLRLEVSGILQANKSKNKTVKQNHPVKQEDKNETEDKDEADDKNEAEDKDAAEYRD